MKNFSIILFATIFASQLLAIDDPVYEEYSQEGTLQPSYEPTIFLKGQVTYVEGKDNSTVAEYCHNFNVATEGELRFRSSIYRATGKENISNVVFWPGSKAEITGETMILSNETLRTLGPKLEDITSNPVTVGAVLRFDASFVGTSEDSTFGVADWLFAAGQPNYGTIKVQGLLMNGKVKPFKTVTGGGVSGFGIEMKYAEALKVNPPMSTQIALPLSGLQSRVLNSTIEVTDPQEAVNFVQ